MAEESWHEERLIPTSGISGAEEQERSATSALLQVKRGQRSWTALVEVNTGSNALDARQLKNYLDIAREQT